MMGVGCSGGWGSEMAGHARGVEWIVGVTWRRAGEGGGVGNMGNLDCFGFHQQLLFLLLNDNLRD